MSEFPDEADVFDEARQISDPEARRVFLERTCAGNPTLRENVEALLAADSAADSFFSTSHQALHLDNVARQATMIGSGTTAPFPAGFENLQNTRIGRYKLLEKIGEGGCGVVYRAVQEEPVRREVALKIIKLGMETQNVIARFEAERQALAMMDHPLIARVYDAGATERGSPYFVMELVRGIRITEFCDQEKLGILQRLELFVRICHAIQHAHQKGIIHRDIKPSNILVAVQDSTALPKVIDFGVSKATETHHDLAPNLTAQLQLIGTPAYMSPEQAALGQIDIDTRSDIYSLGALLYELLAGRTPFDTKTLLSSGIDELRRVIREKEPLRPSALLAGMPQEALQAAAEARQTQPAALLSLLKGDLDWVVMKALEKDRTRRYATANDLAGDIQRFLRFDTVTARPPSALYQLGKLARRKRGLFAAGAAITTALVAGFGTSTWLFLREREAHQRAVEAEQHESTLRKEAEQRERLTQAALKVGKEDFAAADNLVSGMDVSRPTVEGSAVFRALGEWHALENRWAESAARFQALRKIDDIEGWDASTLDALRAGPPLLKAGNYSAYEVFREREVAHALAEPCPASDRILKVSLLRPALPTLLQDLTKIAQDTSRYYTEAASNGDDFRAAWCAESLALWEYRNGHYTAAVDWGLKCVRSRDSNAPRSCTAHAILAMSRFKLGQADEAHRDLTLGREFYEIKMRAGGSRGTPVQGFWFDWTFAELMLQESAELLASPNPS